MEPPAGTESWLTTREAARILQRSEQAVLKLVHTGKLPAEQVARDKTRRQWRIDARAVHARAAAQAAEPERGSGPHHDDTAAAVALAHDTLRDLRTTRTQLSVVHGELDAVCHELAAALAERDRQVTIALDALDAADQLRTELDRLRRAHAALLAAHTALLGEPLP